MSATRTKAASADSIPQIPQTPPPAFGLPNHDFTLQAVMELQKSVGEINSTMKAMAASLDGVKAKVDDLVGWKNKILGGAAVLGVVFAALGFGIGKFSDLYILKSSASPPQVSAVATDVIPQTNKPVGKNSATKQ